MNTRSLNQGTDFMAVVTVANISGTTDYTNLALTHIIPAGWEILMNEWQDRLQPLLLIAIRIFAMTGY